jgi:DNA-binding NarL/FixJ family response regulator
MIASPSLTDRQLDVLRAYAECGSYKIAARRLGLSWRDYKRQLAVIRDRLEVETTVQAVFVVFGR